MGVGEAGKREKELRVLFGNGMKSCSIFHSAKAIS